MKKLLLILCIAITITQVTAQSIVSPTSGPSLKNVSLQLNAHGDPSNSRTSFNANLKPFYHGVASGDPMSDRVIIWTRVTPDSAGTITGNWYVSTDTLANNIVTQGTFSTDSSRDYTVKVDVTGLSSNTTYYYFFQAMGANSLMGRTKTAPTGTTTDHLRFAVTSCSNYEAGYFNAYGRIADRNDLHGIIHLGDYIYEYGNGEYGDTALSNGPRKHDSTETVTLEQYRSRYSLYRLDEDLMRAHQQHPFINIWDDHESANDSYTSGAENHDVTTEGSWTLRKSLAKQAFFEWLPIRDNSDTTIVRTLNYGNLVDLIMIDTRLEGREIQILDVTNPALYSPTRTMLGNAQRNWLLNELDNSSAKWKIVANQVIFSEFHVGWAAQGGQTPQDVENIFLDIWDGYPAERSRIINYIDSANIDNVVWLTGDFHSTFAFDVADTVVDPAAFYAPVPNYDRTTGAGSVAVEFATPSITSANFDENVGALAAAGLEFQINNPLPSPVPPGHIPNPHMKYVDLDQHGYFILDVKDDSTQANWYFVDKINAPSTTESFGQGQYSKDGENHLNTSLVESAEKATQDIEAPKNPPTYGIGTLENNNSFALMSVYPNPATDRVLVQFALANTQDVKVVMYDLTGKIVAELVNGKQNAGVYNLRFERNNLPNGLYLLKISTPEGETTQKIIFN